MSQPRKCTAIKALLMLALWCAASLALAAQVVGTVVHLSGPLMAKKPDGSAKILALKSEVEQGDTLVTEKNTYAQLKFIDNSEITLKPATTFKVDDFAYDDGKPGADSASFTLVKGGLRSVTGLLGKRSKERFALKTPTATIGIRGTSFVVEWVEGGEVELADAGQDGVERTVRGGDSFAVAAAAPLQLAQRPANAAPRPGLAPGLYVHVIDGLINLSNRGGSQQFAAGQFGFTPSFTAPPVVVPRNPGLQFTPPPAFSQPSALNSTTSNRSNSVDCEVR